MYQDRFKRFIFSFAFLMLFWWVTLSAQVQDPVIGQKESRQTEEKAIDLKQDSFGSAVFRTVVALVLVVGLVYLGMYGLKRFVTRNRISGGVPIRVVGSTLLGPKKGIYLVEVEDRRWVLGVTEATISFLGELEKKSRTEFQQTRMDEENRVSRRGFRNYLETLIKKRGSDE